MATTIRRLQVRLGLGKDDETELLSELLASAESAIMARRFPFGYSEDAEMPSQYEDLQIRIAMDMCNRMGAEGQMSHSENGVQRTYESSWISESLLNEIVPMVGTGRNNADAESE